MLSSLSCLSLCIASIIVTVVQFKAVDLINTHGNDIGLYAYRGDSYLALSWAAVAAMFLAIAASAVPLFGETLGRWRIRKPWMKGTA